MTDICKRPTITIDECMKMSSDELYQFIENNKRYITANANNTNSSMIDFKGMSDEAIAKKYGYKTIDEVSDSFKKKLSIST